jgi:hypothetical protein
MYAVGGTAEVVARLVAIIEGWLDSLVASPKILRTQMMIVNEGPLLAQSGRSHDGRSLNGRGWCKGTRRDVAELRKQTAE